MLNAFNLREGEPINVFDTKRLFYEHLASMRYDTLFNRFAEGIGDNDLNTPKKREMKTCNEDLVIEVSTNSQCQRNKMKHKGMNATNTIVFLLSPSMYKFFLCF